MSPINYFNQLKIQKACQLLDFTDKKAKEIAFELAFSDPYYFSKVFTKYMHMSPKEYRMKKKGMRKLIPFFLRIPLPGLSFLQVTGLDILALIPNPERIT